MKSRAREPRRVSGALSPPSRSASQHEEGDVIAERALVGGFGAGDQVVGQTAEVASCRDGTAGQLEQPTGVQPLPDLVSGFDDPIGVEDEGPVAAEFNRADRPDRIGYCPEEWAAVGHRYLADLESGGEHGRRVSSQAQLGALEIAVHGQVADSGQDVVGVTLRTEDRLQMAETSSGPHPPSTRARHATRKATPSAASSGP